MKLIIAPHLDDEVLGCGGVLGPDSHVFFCGLQEAHVLPAKERLVEAENASKLLGHTYQIHQGTIVNRYDSRDYVDVFEQLINRLKPEKVYIPYGSYNQDHRAIHDAAMIALRPHDKNWFVKKVLVYEELDAAQWYKPGYEVNHFVEIDMDRKLRGYSCHASQVRAHRSRAHLIALATLRGSQIGVPYAEAFIVKRWVE
jgi:LmbE family N-acetylglucosaminyl deacetylase